MNRHTKWIITAIVLVSTAITPGIRAQFLNEISPEAMQQISALETEKENRTPAQQKINSALLYALKMERGEAIAPGVQTMSINVGATSDGQVTVIIVADSFDSTFLDALNGMGVKIVASYPQSRTVQVTALLRQLETIAALPQVLSIRPQPHVMTNQFPTSDVEPLLPHRMYLTAAERVEKIRQQLIQAGYGPAPETITNGHDKIGSASAEGVITHGFYSARGTFNADGTGIRIGVLSDSVNAAPLAASQASGDMPPTCSSLSPPANEHCVNIVPGQAGPATGNEGLGMMEVIHDLVPGAHPIIPVMLGDAALATRMADALLAEGVYVIGFSYPVVPKGKARIRTQMSAAHTDEQIDLAVAAFAKVGKALGAIKEKR